MSAQRFDELYRELQRLLQQPPMLFDSTLQRVVASEPYQQLVALGPADLPYFIEKIAAGEFFLNDAALRLMRVTRQQLGLDRFPSEQEVSAAILRTWDSVLNQEVQTVAPTLAQQQPLQPTTPASTSVQRTRRPRECSGPIEIGA